jgi:hypothetical protein
MSYTDIPKEKLDSWWSVTASALAANPKDWDAIRDQCLLENEYTRRGWPIPQ